MKAFIALFFFAQASLAAVSGSTVWEIRSTATSGNVNGCGFVTGSGGTDYSQQDASQYSGSNLASTSGTTNPCVVTSASHNFVSTDVGNLIHVTAGTNWTAGWYQIVSAAGNAATLDRACGTSASLSSGTFAVGGACSLGASGTGVSDDALFESGISGNIFYVKNGSYSPTAVSIAAAGSATNHIAIVGYNSSRSDAPMGSSRPSFNLGANGFNLGSSWDASYLIVTGTAANVFSAGANAKLFFVKASNTSGTAGRNAIITSSSAYVFGCEANSTNGAAISTANNYSIEGSYFHDSATGVSDGSTLGTSHIHNTVIETTSTTAINVSVAATGDLIVDHCTMWGGSSPTGTGVTIATGATNIRITNSIISNFSTGISHADATNAGVDDYNDYFGNTSDTSNWTKGPHDIAVNPGFADAPNGNFAVGPALKRTGLSGALTLFPWTSYNAMGAVQRREYGRPVNPR